ncbi:laminin subunit alpha-3 isoform X2 [Rhineura floridana]|uniref:laminin subunit alpha-3 isoform X2 n=1 Tax=Rhineura floridana TaxID=261503 RepID=UPI002AC86F86|nr:laminin subunit alpha-3 isoform X2 [Rhineura floridana]
MPEGSPARMARSRATAPTPPGAAMAGIVLALWSHCCFADSQMASPDDSQTRGLSLHPPYFNLAETARIWATATCGQDEGGRPRLELYCKLVGGPAASPAGQTIQGQFCDYCNGADPSKAHPITNAIDGTERWWQSPSLSLGLTYDEVNVTLDLEQYFHVAYVLIKFANSPRPDLWVLERSIDFGRTYIPWQYFAYSKASCWERFRKEANARVRKNDDVICTTEYSRIVPLENGEIVISLVNGRPGANNFTHSLTLREFTKATNIRLRFLRTNTLLGHLISKAQRDPTVTRRYYYSIKDISVGGQCVCHGHADICDAKSDLNSYRYQCECQHNTCGETCDHCCPGYNQKQWQPATASSTNLCESCNCHGHASDCYYDPEVEQRKESLNLYGKYQGGGVCMDCQHNTAGVNCEKCVKGYYRHYSVPVTAAHGCIPCSCNPDHSDGCEEGSGRCFCRLNYQGETCDQCAEGYHSFPFCYRIPVYPVTTASPEDPSAGHIVGGGCKPGFFGPDCYPCQCHGSGVIADGDCDRQTGQCRCRDGFWGIACDRCGVGYFHYPFCQMCECNLAGTQPEICDYLGRCLCRIGVDGFQCNTCHPGYHSFPFCQECNCDAAGSVDSTCGFEGRCHCHINYAGPKCSQCAPGYYSYPNCLPCQCSTHGSHQAACDLVTGQCKCRPGITGQQCDRCFLATNSFPQCQGVSTECDLAGAMDSYSVTGFCQCLQNVEGPTCSICKPLYWNLARENPDGCIECQCDASGTLSGVRECRQVDGECYCKPSVCGDSCDTCEDGYYGLEDKNYFGCQGCKCDVGGSVSHVCNDLSGDCQCRRHIAGKSCNEPRKDYYLPDLHHMKFEVEDGTSPNGRGIRFGYDPQEFPGFSWRGYAQMSSVQNEVRITLNVEKSNPDLFHVILRYINPGTAVVSGHLIAYHSRLRKGAPQSKDIVFPPSKQPAFVTVPGKSFADPFSLSPGTWIFKIMAEGVLLDYLVLLPRDYYEATILQLPVTEPCTYSRHATTDNCLQYEHLPLDRFCCVLGSEVTFFLCEGEYRKVAFQQPTAKHPVMSHINGQEVELQIRLNVPQVGRYVVVFEYVNEHDQVYVGNVKINSPGQVMEARINIYSCKYSFLCRSIVIDDMHRVAIVDLLADAELHLRASAIDFFLHKACIIPLEDFSLEYVEPKVYCIATSGHSADSSALCIPSQYYETPPVAMVLDALRDGQVAGMQRNVVHQESLSSPLPYGTHTTNAVILTSSQNQIILSGRVTHLGRYVFLIHFYQSENPTFLVDVTVDGGRLWSGSYNASFCPHIAGCRGLVMAENQIELGVSQHDISVTVKIPHGKMLMLEHVLAVPADSYSSRLLHRDTVDKSFDFISQCGGNSFYINPATSSEFCRTSARSLVAAYNDGALPCNCHRNGATSRACNPKGGQCNCRQHVIGRRCSRCRTGYYGFPFCKPCSCGRRLCDDITGKCICPPQTVKPRCEVCVRQHFGYHPLTGCEGCNCSSKGVINPVNPECDKIVGQCKCRLGITGRRCDHCAPGSYGFPNCKLCKCNREGTEPTVCHPQTGVCLCKENVEGIHCDMCRSGSFYLDSANPKGCTSCFCFGATNICRSTNKRRVKFNDMRNWHLEAVETGMNVPVTFNPGSNSVVADVQELPPSVRNLYWVAPSSYLGEKLSSYGGYLSYQVKSFGLPSEGMTLLEKRPDVQLTGQHMKIIYMDPNDPLPDKQYYGSVQLVEGNFRHASSSNLVSREELMMVLSRLDGLQIRGLYFTESQRLALGEVGLEEATNTGNGIVAYNVETCSCPSEYVGDSCQGCRPEFYRENNGLLTGRCVPCNCNGNADRCLDGSGICINCQHNTAGEKCERCKEGYFRDDSQGTCRMCRCPYTNSFASGCVENSGEIQCFCKEGYTGVHCERCAPGYFGNPLKYGGYCQKCNCLDNGQLMNCDRLTGECISQEPKDTDPLEDCDSCDSCVITLLKDLSTMGNELHLIKSQIQNVNASAHTLEQMKQLEDRVKQLKILLSRYRSIITTQSPKVDELETDLIELNQNINALKEKAENNYRKAETLFNNFSKTNQRGKDLVSKIQSIVTNINVLLEQIAGTSTEGTSLPSRDAAKELAQAQQMINEMRNRNFGQQLTEAKEEKGEAQILLDRVRNELQKHQAKNQRLIKIIRDSINEYESKLSDLRVSLKDAKEQTKLAESLNGNNKVLLEDVKKRIEEMTKQQKDILDHLSSAQASLSQANSLFGLLQRSKEEYENLAAQLDGARKDLNEKLKSHSLSASKEPLVVRAEEHANFLQDLARKLDEIKKNASNDELVTCAVEAATAYENIIDAIKAAEAAANRASNAADSALSTMEKKDLAGKAKRLKTKSDNLLNQAQAAQKTLQEISPTLADLKSRVEDAESKKNIIKGDLTTFKTGLQGINRDDIDNMIASAKNMVKNANDITANVLGELNPIKADVEKIMGSYGSMQSADYNKALNDANSSVKNLTNILPDLFNKITSINEQLMPIGNISENIDRIRELIHQARDAANKVAIPMRFNGSSGVEVRPPDILDDLKGYTSLSLFLQRPLSRLDSPRRQTSNMFVMYLGDKDSSKDYIGMAVRDGHLICAYSLGGNEAEIEVPESVYESDTKDATLDLVRFERIYQYAKLNYIQGATSNSPLSLGPFDDRSGSSHTLLNLDPDSVVFYVGGYPPDFTPPSALDYPRYEGCIELDSLNERVISLYNFKRSFNLDTSEVQPCRRYKEQSAKIYFEGTGYAHVNVTSPNKPYRRYEQTIQTTTDEGLVLFAENQDKFISLRIEKGHLVFRYKVDSQPPKEIASKVVINNGMDQIVVLHIGPQLVTLIDKSREQININMFPFDSYYLGGIPASVRERFNIYTPPFRGCMMNVRTSFESSPTFSETLGVSRKCPDDWKLVRTATFSKNGVLGLSDDAFPFPNDFQIGFGFHTLALDGTLLNYNLRPDVLTLLLRNGSVIIRLADEESQSTKRYEDGSMHYVTVIKEGDMLKLLVDDVPESTIVGTLGRKTLSQPIELGGSGFEGCISNVFIQRSEQFSQVQNLTNYIEKTNVSLGSCMIKKLPQLMLLKDLNDAYSPKVLKRKKPIAYLTEASVQQNKGCTSHAQLNFVTGAYHFGNTASTHLLFVASQISSKDRSHFAVDVRTSSSRGLIFFMGDKLENRYMALFLSKGRYVFLLAADGRKIKIKSKAKYNDGHWHTVVFSRAGKKARLVVDGLKVREGNIAPSYFAMMTESPIYLGGVPSLKIQNIPGKSFVGCLRNFNVGGKLMRTYHQNNGVLPCLENTLENGISFFNEGGHIVIENAFVMNLEYRIIFNIRPRSLNSILIHTGSKQENYLTLYMEEGVLTASGNNGAGKFSTSVTPRQSLCDGKWHSIAVTQKQNTVHLEVDSKSNSTTGPSAILSTSHPEPLYFGRVPVNLATPWLPVQDVFLGCLKDVAINDKTVLVSKISDVHGVVSLQGCPLN